MFFFNSHCLLVLFYEQFFSFNSHSLLVLFYEHIFFSFLFTLSSCPVSWAHIFLFYSHCLIVLFHEHIFFFFTHTVFLFCFMSTFFSIFYLHCLLVLFHEFVGELAQHLHEGQVGRWRPLWQALSHWHAEHNALPAQTTKTHTGPVSQRQVWQWQVLLHWHAEHNALPAHTNNKKHPHPQSVRDKSSSPPEGVERKTRDNNPCFLHED